MFVWKKYANLGRAAVLRWLPIEKIFSWEKSCSGVEKSVGKNYTAQFTYILERFSMGLSMSRLNVKNKDA